MLPFLVAPSLAIVRECDKDFNGGVFPISFSSGIFNGGLVLSYRSLVCA